ETENILQFTDVPTSAGAAENTSPVVLVCEPSATSAYAASAVEEEENATIAEGFADESIPSAAEIETNESDPRADSNQADGFAVSAADAGPSATAQLTLAGDAEAQLTTSVGDESTLTSDGAPAPAAENDRELSLPILPDPAGISVRLRNLVVTVG